MARYRRDVSRDRYPVGLGGDPKNFGIGVPSGIHPSGAAKIYCRFPPPQSSADLGV
jgi:hypothetical protein